MAANVTSTVPNMRFDNSLGAILVGGLVSAALLGLTTLQTYLYFINYPNDRAAYKWLVGFLWLLDVVHSIFISHAMYHFLVEQYGNPIALLQGEWSIIGEVGVTSFVTLLVQGFMAHRVYKLSENNWLLAGIIVLLTLSHVALALVCVARLVQIRFFYKIPEVIGIMSATLVMMAANDAFTTMILCWLLRRAESKFAETQSMIRLLIVYTIETGLLTSVFVTIDAICILTMPHNWIFIGITFCVCKLYANSLLTVLNSRHSLQTKREAISHKISASNKTNRQSGYLTSIRMQDISIRTEKDVQVELVKPEVTFVGPSHETNHLGFAI